MKEELTWQGLLKVLLERIRRRRKEEEEDEVEGRSEKRGEDALKLER